MALVRVPGEESRYDRVNNALRKNAHGPANRAYGPTMDNIDRGAGFDSPLIDYLDRVVLRLPLDLLSRFRSRSRPILELPRASDRSRDLVFELLLAPVHTDADLRRGLNAREALASRVVLLGTVDQSSPLDRVQVQLLDYRPYVRRDATLAVRHHHDVGRIRSDSWRELHETPRIE